jgi:hypothetical protein
MATIHQFLPVLNRIHVFGRQVHVFGDDVLAALPGGDVADLPLRPSLRKRLLFAHAWIYLH